MLRPIQAAIAMADARERRDHLRDAVRLALAVMRNVRNGQSELAAVDILDDGSRAAAVLRAQVTGQTTENSNLYAAEITAAILAAAVRGSFFDAILANAIPGFVATQFGMITSAATGGSATEGKARLVGRWTTTTQSMEPSKVATLVGLSNNLLELAFQGRITEEFLGRVLGASIIAAQDAVALPLVTAGAQTQAASGFDPAGVRFDIRRALEKLPLDAASRVHLGVSPTVAKRLAMASTNDGAAAFPEMGVQGGRIGDIAVSVSDGLTADAVLADATAFVAYGGPIKLKSGAHATIEMDTAPANAIADGASPETSVEATMVSMFQADASALFAEREIAISPIRTAAVRITGVSTKWGLVGSPPA